MLYKIHTFLFIALVSSAFADDEDHYYIDIKYQNKPISLDQTYTPVRKLIQTQLKWLEGFDVAKEIVQRSSPLYELHQLEILPMGLYKNIFKLNSDSKLASVFQPGDILDKIYLSEEAYLAQSVHLFHELVHLTDTEFHKTMDKTIDELNEVNAQAGFLDSSSRGHADLNKRALELKIEMEKIVFIAERKAHDLQYQLIQEMLNERPELQKLFEKYAEEKILTTSPISNEELKARYQLKNIPE